MYRLYGVIGYKAIHVGEVLTEYNSGTGVVEIHHYIDMGKHDRPKDYSPTKNVKDLRVYPEYVEESTGVSYTRKRNTTQLPSMPIIILLD